jgi:hypothetical protein
MDGKIPESIPDGVQNCLNHKLVVNFNLWVVGGRTVTGHKEPEEIMDITKVPNTHILVCAMNPPAFEYCLKHNIHCYYSTNEKFSLTSKGIPLSFCSAPLEGSILMAPDECLGVPENVVGICSPYILGYIV